MIDGWSIKIQINFVWWRILTMDADFCFVSWSSPLIHKLIADDDPHPCHKSSNPVTIWGSPTVTFAFSIIRYCVVVVDKYFTCDWPQRLPFLYSDVNHIWSFQSSIFLGYKFTNRLGTKATIIIVAFNLRRQTTTHTHTHTYLRILDLTFSMPKFLLLYFKRKILCL